MRTIASLSLVALLGGALAGCHHRHDQVWYTEADSRDPQCHVDEGGRADVRYLERMVDDFLTSAYTGPQDFRGAKRQLLADLDDAYNRGCGWERNEVASLWQRVHDFRYRDAWD